MEFTKEVINLCKQIAQKHRKEIKCGDWILRNDKLVLNLDGKLAWSDDAKQDIIITITTKVETIPLWTISDCLEFFNERAIYLEGLEQIDECEYMCAICEMDDLGIVKGTVRSFEGNTPLEACLIAVLAMLEDSNR